MTTHVTAQKAPSAWRRWRADRPFWGGLLLVLAGVEILFVVRAPLPVVMHVGMQGMIGYLIPILLLLCGVLLLFNPAQRLFYSTISAVFALASWATSNLGGFVIGMLLALVGSALAFAWTPNRKQKQPPAVEEPAEEMSTDDLFARESAEEPAEEPVEEPAGEPVAESAEEPAENADSTGPRHRSTR